MTGATAAVSPLRRRMIDDMSLRNLSPATQRSYVHAVKRFSQFHSRSPDQLGFEDVRAFQVYLVSQGVSWGALNQTVCALRFFYGATLDRAEIPERIAYARTPRKLPDILSANEVVRFLEAVPSLKARAALTTAQAAGLRASETVSLKIGDMQWWLSAGHCHAAAMAIRAVTATTRYLMTIECGPHIDRINVTTSASMDVGKPHARDLADWSEVSNHCAKLARKCRRTRQSPRSTMTLMPRPHRYGSIVSPQAANLEPASRH